MSKPLPLKIGDKIYRNVLFGGIFSYEVIAIHRVEYGSDKSVEQYQVRCLNCKHNDPACEILVGFVGGTDKGEQLQFIQCLNNRGEDYEDEDGDDVEDQSSWHSYLNDGYFFRSLKECKRERFKKNKEYIESQIKETTELYNTRMKNLKESLARAEADIKANEEE